MGKVELGKDVILIENGIDKNGRRYNLKELDLIGRETPTVYGYVGEIDDQLRVDLGKVSHKVTNIRMEGDNLVGTVTILHTPQGQIAKALMENGVGLHTAISGLGYIDKNNVVRDYQLRSVNLLRDDQ